MKRIAIFASGGGSNTRKFLEYFENIDNIEIGLIVTNRKSAGVLNHASEFDVPALYIDRNYFVHNNYILEVLKEEQIDFIVLAGFLWLIPKYLIEEFPNKIVNIHPALLPNFGGKGMYGHHVHEAVKNAGETLSGITIHYVNEKYDDGAHIFQSSCEIDSSDTPEDIAKKVLTLEHLHYTTVVHKLLLDTAN